MQIKSFDVMRFTSSSPYVSLEDLINQELEKIKEDIEIINIQSRIGSEINNATVWYYFKEK